MVWRRRLHTALDRLGTPSPASPLSDRATMARPLNRRTVSHEQFDLACRRCRYRARDFELLRLPLIAEVLMACGGSTASSSPAIVWTREAGARAWLKTLHEARLIRQRLLTGFKKTEPAVSPKEFSVVSCDGILWHRRYRPVAIQQRQPTCPRRYAFPYRRA